MRASTTDLYEAAFLVCAGHGLADTWVDSGRSRAAVVFVFDDENDLCEHQRNYRTGAATVNVAEFRRQINVLRDRIRSVTTEEKMPRRGPRRDPETRRNQNHANTHRSRP